MSVIKHKATGTGNIAETISPGGNFQIEEFRIHLSAAGAANSLTITIDNGDGAAYDVVVLTQDMTSVTNFIWVPTRPVKCKNLGTTASSIVIAWTNGSSRTYGLELFMSLIA